MFSWLKALFGSNPPDERLDIYRPKERLIYRYFDGEKDVAEDPMILYKRLMDVWHDLSIDIKTSRHTAYKDSRPAHTRAVEAIRKIFTIKALKDGGLTEIETTDLLDHFFIYCGGEKKNTNEPPTTSKPTEPPPSPTSGGGQATGQVSDSGCAETEPFTEKPTSSPSA